MFNAPIRQEPPCAERGQARGQASSAWSPSAITRSTGSHRLAAVTWGMLKASLPTRLQLRSLPGSVSPGLSAGDDLSRPHCRHTRPARGVRGDAALASSCTLSRWQSGSVRSGGERRRWNEEGRSQRAAGRSRVQPMGVELGMLMSSGARRGLKWSKMARSWGWCGTPLVQDTCQPRPSHVAACGRIRLSVSGVFMTAGAGAVC
jgi:hypothetical protein